MRSRVHPVGLVLAAGVALCGAWAFSRAQAVNPLPKYLLTDKKLVLLSAPQVVAGPVVMDAQWSPDGVHIAAIRKTERQVLDHSIAAMRMVVWSAGKGSHEIWQREMTISAQPRITWLTPEVVTVEMKWNETVQNTDAAGNITLADVKHAGILWVNVTREDVKMMPLMPGDHLYVSPSRPYAALWSPAQLQVTVLKPDGTALKKSAMPNNMVWFKAGNADDWSDDGVHVWLMGSVRADNNGHPQPIKTYSLNVQTGVLEAATKPDAAVKRSAPPALRLARTLQSVKLGNSTQFLHPLWLESATGGEHPEALLAADSTGGTLSPLGEAVLYLSAQTAFVTPLRIGPKEPFVTNLKATLASNAKQLGLAMVMYAQDYDETFPTPSDSLQSAIDPYLRNGDLFDGFNYTYSGGPIGSITNPAETQLGAVEGPGGQWIIYSDGHVRWHPN